MKNILVALMLAVAPISFVSCKSPHTAQQLAIKSLETTWQSVHSARVIYAGLYKDGKINAETHVIALAADKNFRDNFEQALLAAEQDWKSVTPRKVAVAAESFITIVYSIVRTK